MPNPIPPKPPVLTQSIIDVADCHTTPYYFDEQAPTPSPLPFLNQDNYQGLYQKVSVPKGLAYSDARNGTAGVVLNRLKPAYYANKYWRQYLRTREIALFPQRSWSRMLPLKCSLLPPTAIDFIPSPKFQLRVSPHPRVLLYPFGWSTWVSLLLNGEHTLADLAAFVSHICTAQIFRINSAAKDFTLRSFFDHVAGGVRNDAFGGGQTNDQDFQHISIVTTVLAKRRATYSLDGVSATDQNLILQIVKPEGPSAKGTLKDYALRRKSGQPTEYVVTNDYNSFIWMESLLDPVDRKHEHLRCYHNNTFHSMIQARHQYELLLGASDFHSSPGKDLIKIAIEELKAPARADNRISSDNYCNLNLVKFLESPAVANARTAASEKIK